MTKKYIIIVLVSVLAAAGVWFFFRDTEEPARSLAEKAVGVHYVGGGTHVIEGAVLLPNPCYNLFVTAEKRSGAPEQVLLRFMAEKTAEVCAQVLFEAPFRITFDAADNAVLSAEINGISMPLELAYKERVSVPDGRDFSIRFGEERWVEDIKLVLVGVENDSRCPTDVTCIQAGWVTLRLKVDDEEITLRFPGDAQAPNAAVVGSYIVTLVGVEPYPVSKETLQEADYTAIIRVEAHDIKG